MLITCVFMSACRLIILIFITIFVLLSSLVGTYSFETGTERSFSFVNDVNVYELKTAAESSIGYRISGDLKVASIYGDSDNGYLFKYEVKSLRRILIQFFNYLTFSFYHQNYISKNSKYHPSNMMMIHRRFSIKRPNCRSMRSGKQALSRELL